MDLADDGSPKIAQRVQNAKFSPSRSIRTKGTCNIYINTQFTLDYYQIEAL